MLFVNFRMGFLVLFTNDNIFLNDVFQRVDYPLPVVLTNGLLLILFAVPGIFFPATIEVVYVKIYDSFPDLQ